LNGKAESLALQYSWIELQLRIRGPVLFTVGMTVDEFEDAAAT
jgi:hypothetical protein